MATKVSLYDGGDTILPIDVVDSAIQLCEFQDWPSLREVVNAAEETLAVDNKGVPWLRNSVSYVLSEVFNTVGRLTIDGDWYGALRDARDEMPWAVED